MASYIAQLTLSPTENFIAVTGLLEALVGQVVAGEVMLRNVLALPRSGELLLCAEAPSALHITRFAERSGLAITGITEGTVPTWRTLRGPSAVHATPTRSARTATRH